MRRAWYASSNVEPGGRSGGAQLFDRGALLAEERAAETGDEVREDLALVVVVGTEVQARARAELTARAGQPSVVRVPAELLVLDADVVGPRQDLPVQALHVVALVERVDDGLPVRVDDRAQRRAQAHLFEVVRTRAASGSGSRKSSNGSASGSRLTNTNPPQVSTPHRRQREVVGQADELVAVGNVDEPAVERVTPAVIRAPDRRRRRTSRSRRRAAGPGAGTRCRTRAARRSRRGRSTTVSSPIVYSKKSPGAATCSSRHAICQTRGHSRVCSSSANVAGGVALLGHEAVGPHEQGLRGRSCQNRTVAASQRGSVAVQSRRSLRAGGRRRPRTRRRGVRRRPPHVRASSTSDRPGSRTCSRRAAPRPAPTSRSTCATRSSISRRCSRVTSSARSRST